MSEIPPQSQVYARLIHVNWVDDSTLKRYFHFQNMTTGEVFRICSHFCYFGNILRRANLDIYLWEQGDFREIIKQCIHFKIDFKWADIEDVHTLHTTELLDSQSHLEMWIQKCNQSQNLDEYEYDSEFEDETYLQN